MDAVSAEFSEALAAYALDAVELTVNPTVLAELRGHVARGRLVLLGEAHGVDENAAIAHALIELLELRGLALEWSCRLRSLVDRFLESGELELRLEPEQLRHVARFFEGVPIAAGDEEVDRALDFYSPDGRVTAGYFALLRRLHDRGLLEQLILFHASGQNRSERDAAMARQFLDGWDRRTPLLLIAGNAHTPRREHGHGRPLRAHVAEAVPDAVEVVIDYLSGWHYNFGLKPFLRRSDAKGVPRLVRRDDYVYAVELGDVRAATVARPPAP